MENSIVVNGVTYYRTQPKTDNYKDKYYCLVLDLKDYIKDAEAIYEEFKALGLNFNSIEVEGYLRSAKMVEDIIKKVEEYMSEI